MKTFYHSTRSADEAVTSKQAILTGIAPDGGLYVSDQLGQEKLALSDVVTSGYHAIARNVLSVLLSDYTADEISSCVAGAYAENFDTPLVTPLSPVGSDWLLELWHGPTCAFKDVALQMLPRLMSTARTGTASQGGVMIVTATSGDTGKAALDGFADVAGTGVTVFYPAGKVSDIQRLQMVTQRGGNVAVAGDCECLAFDRVVFMGEYFPGIVQDTEAGRFRTDQGTAVCETFAECISHNKAVFARC